MGLEAEKDPRAARGGATPPPRGEDVPARDDVRLRHPPQRCPYCHDDVARDEPGQVACRACLGRHHRACWEEAGRCAACGAAVGLGESAGPAPRRAPRGQALATALAVVCTLVAGTCGVVAWLDLARPLQPAELRPPPPPVDDLGGSDEEVTARLRARAEAGDTGAMNLLGFRLLQGLGCRRDEAEAYRWGLKAAEAGHAEAMFGVALLLEQGAQGVPQDEPAAAAWYRRAVAAGDTMAGPALERLLQRRPDLR